MLRSRPPCSRSRVGKHSSPVSVEGPPDSVPVLVDRLTAELLAGEGGRTELASLTSLPALRAYFDGQRAYRLGRWSGRVAGVLKSNPDRLDVCTCGDEPLLRLPVACGRPLAAGHRPRAAGQRSRGQIATRLSPRDRCLAPGAGRSPLPRSVRRTPSFLRPAQRGVAAAPDSPEDVA